MNKSFSTHDIVEGIGGAGLIGIHILLLPLLRGYRLQWRTTEEEANANLPGDELVGNPKLRMTWGITINAPIEDVWPWVVQMGQGRGGFYTYQFLENIAARRFTWRDFLETRRTDACYVAGDLLRLVPV